MYFSCFGTLDLEIAKGVEAGSLGRHSHAFSSSGKSGMKPLEEADEQVDEQADELEDQAIMVELDGPEEEPTEDEAEDPESEGKYYSSSRRQLEKIFPCYFLIGWGTTGLIMWLTV